MTVDEAIKCYQAGMRVKKALVVNKLQDKDSNDFKLFKQFESNCNKLLTLKKNKKIAGTDLLDVTEYNDVPKPRTLAVFFQDASQSSSSEYQVGKQDLSNAVAISRS